MGNIPSSEQLNLELQKKSDINNILNLYTDVNLRPNYVTKMHNLLSEKGKISGLLFDFPLTEVGPPFGGSQEEYVNLFSEKLMEFIK